MFVSLEGDTTQAGLRSRVQFMLFPITPMQLTPHQRVTKQATPVIIQESLISLVLAQVLPDFGEGRGKPSEEVTTPGNTPLRQTFPQQGGNEQQSGGLMISAQHVSRPRFEPGVSPGLNAGLNPDQRSGPGLHQVTGYCTTPRPSSAALQDALNPTSGPSRTLYQDLGRQQGLAQNLCASVTGTSDSTIQRMSERRGGPNGHDADVVRPHRLARSSGVFARAQSASSGKPYYTELLSQKIHPGMVYCFCVQAELQQN